MIISILGFEPGVGVSTITINIAAQLALSNQRVAVVEGRIHEYGVPDFFRGSQRTTDSFNYSLLDFFDGLCLIEEAAYRIGEHATEDSLTYARLKDKPLWFVPLTGDAGDCSRILREGYDFNEFNKAVQRLRTSFRLDCVLIQIRGLDDASMLTAAISDCVIVTFEPRQRSFQSTAVFIDVAHSLDIPNVLLLANKALNRYDFWQMKEQLEATFGAPIAGILPLSEDVIDLDSTDIFSLRYPEHPWSRTLSSASSILLTPLRPPEQESGQGIEGVNSKSISNTATTQITPKNPIPNISGMEPALSRKHRRR